MNLSRLSAALENAKIIRRFLKSAVINSIRYCSIAPINSHSHEPLALTLSIADTLLGGISIGFIASSEFFLMSFVGFIRAIDLRSPLLLRKRRRIKARQRSLKFLCDLF